MTRITLDDAARRSLKDVVGEACAKQETIVVTGPQGEIARIVPSVPPSVGSASKRWKGRLVHDAEELAQMSEQELRSIGWVFPDESAWVDEVSDVPGQPPGKRD